MESNNSLSLSHFHQFVQENHIPMPISSNVQHSPDSLFSISSDTSYGSTEVNGNPSRRERQRKSSSNETNETNLVQPIKKSKKYANLPDDVAESKRLKVNELEKERQRQINKVFSELKDLNLPELMEPGTKIKKYSKSYIVRNTRCVLQQLHNEKLRLSQKLQQKMQRNELVLVGQGILPNDRPGNISEILNQVQSQHGVEGIQNVPCIAYSDFIVASSITPVMKTLNTGGGRYMQTPINLGSGADRNTVQVQSQASQCHSNHFDPSSNIFTNQQIHSPTNEGRFVFGQREKTQQQTTSGCRDNISVSSNSLARQHIQANFNAGHYPMRNADCSQIYNAATATNGTGYAVSVTAGNITPSKAKTITLAKPDNVFSGSACHNEHVQTRGIESAHCEKIVSYSLGGKLPFDAFNTKQNADDVVYTQSDYFRCDNTKDGQPVVTYNNALIRSKNTMSAYCSDNLAPDTLGYRLPVSAVNVKQANSTNYAPFNSYGHSNTGENNSVFSSGYKGQTSLYQ